MKKMHCEYHLEEEKGWRRFVPNPYLLALALVALLLIVVPLSLILSLRGKEVVPESKADRIACPGIKDEADCVAKLCRYEKTQRGPPCFMDKDQFGYRVVNVTQESDGPSVRLESITYENPYGFSTVNVLFKLTYLSENILRFQFKDADRERYEVPVQEHFPLLRNPSAVADEAGLAYRVDHTDPSDLFHFKIRRTNGTILWDSSLGALLLSDQFLQIGSYLPSPHVYGLGEHVHDTLKHSLEYVSWPLFARDTAPSSTADGKNLYGVHPFYTCLEHSGKSHGVLFLNSNAMEVTFLPAPAVTFRTIGGILDFFVFVGEGPEHVVQLYTSLVGRPMIPPYWGLGFQLSRYGYNDLGTLKKVVERNRNASIPQAVQYLDIDHFEANKDFTYDNVSFAGLPEFIEQTKREQDLKWVVIVDPALAAEPDYAPYSSGLDQSVFVKRPSFWNPAMFPEELEKHNVTYGQVWPKSRVAFPDFFLNATQGWWKEWLLEYRKTIAYDGLWIDMNEPANFATDPGHEGHCVYDRGPNSTCTGTSCPESRFEDPPYNPVVETGDVRLSTKTLCMESVQGGGDRTYRHYDVHSLYGWSETLPTLQAGQEATGGRSMVVTRSTYPSSGQFSGHWLGDNFATYDSMKRSIIGMLEFNMFGIPYVGADVCGYFEDADSELCMRWMQLGAFYPFFRNHNGMGHSDQDPAAFDEPVIEASRRAVERRLSLNPYLYTLFYRAHVDGSTVARPLFHEFPLEFGLLNLSDAFMWGRSLLVAPILGPGRKVVHVHLPKAEWWLFKEQKSKFKRHSPWYMIEKDADEYTPLYVRGGTVLPYHNYDPRTYNASSNYRNISLYIFPTEGEAVGELFMDDGISKDTVENGAYALYEFKYANCSLQITSREEADFAGVYPVLEEVVVFKVKAVEKAGNYTVSSLDERHNSVVITVNSQLSEVKEVTWEDGEGKCTMIP